MFSISPFAITFIVFLVIPDGAICAGKKTNVDKLAEQQISVIGKLGCSGLDDNAVKAKIVLKVSRNGKEIISSNYPSKNSQQKESLLISTKRTEPKFLFLQIIPNNPEGSKCNKTIQGKVRMREFKVLKGGNKNDKVLDVGDCDFLTGKCTKFSKSSDLQTVSIVGEIFCPGSKNVKTTIIMKPKRHVEEEIKRQTFDSQKRTSSPLLEAQTKEPNTVFLRIVPDASMGSACGKTIEAKLGMREFKVQGEKGTFDVGKCNLNTGKCTKFPFPQ